MIQPRLGQVVGVLPAGPVEHLGKITVYDISGIMFWKIRKMHNFNSVEDLYAGHQADAARLPS